MKRFVQIPNGDRTIYGELYLPEGESVCPVVIMSHGYNGSAADFEKEGNFFAANGVIAIAYDFCGGSAHAKSTGASVDMTIFREKEDLLAVLDYMKKMDRADQKRIFLFGASQGGFVTALAGAERKAEVEGLILYFPAFCIPDDWRKRYPETDKIPETTEFWGLTLGREYFMSIREFDPYEVIGEFDRSVLIFHGDQDDIVPLSYSEKAAQVYTKAELKVLKNEGHGFSEEAGKKAAEAALQWINR